MASQIAPDVLGGTWEEISAIAPNYNGHRLRLTILPQDKPAAPEPSLRFKPPGLYAARLKEEREALEHLPQATPEEIAEAEAEAQELLNNLNENRRLEGADLFF